MNGNFATACVTAVEICVCNHVVRKSGGGCFLLLLILLLLLLELDCGSRGDRSNSQKAAVVTLDFDTSDFVVAVIDNDDDDDDDGTTVDNVVDGTIVGGGAGGGGIFLVW